MHLIAVSLRVFMGTHYQYNRVIGFRVTYINPITTLKPKDVQR